MNVPALDLGIPQEELREQVIERASDKLVEHLTEDGRVKSEVRAVVEDTITAVVEKIAEEELRPWVEGRVESVVLEQTNEWGERIGKEMTFREYLVDRAKEYLLEPVNYDGKNRAESRHWNHKETQTRIAHMIDRHLHYQIETAMKEALANANSQVAEGIAETARMKLAEIAGSLKVKVT